MLWATARRAPVASAASTSALVPSIRTRLFAWNTAGSLQSIRSRQRGELVDDRVGRGVVHGRPHAVGIEDVTDDRVGAGRLELSGAQHRAGHGRHLVPRGQQLRHERAADHAGRAGQEHPHRVNATSSGPAARIGSPHE
jgi:hypothetical protein